MELLTLKELCKLLQCSQQTLWRRRKDDDTFPQPVKSFLLIPKRWRKADILAWLE